MLELYFVSNLVTTEDWNWNNEHYLVHANTEGEAIDKVATAIDQDDKSMLSAEPVQFDTAWEVATLPTCLTRR